MKAITTKENLPKFIMVNKDITATSYNKYLPVPWVNGEIVKVAPYEEQVPNHKYDDTLKYSKSCTDKEFRSRYVKVIRKDSEGKWVLNRIESWNSFNLLKRK